MPIHANKNSRNNNNNNNYARNDQVKIYFPSIPIQVLQNALHGTPNSVKKQNQNIRSFFTHFTFEIYYILLFYIYIYEHSLYFVDK